MRVTADEYACLQQLARGDADPLPLDATQTLNGWHVTAEWAVTQTLDWRASHDPYCHCWKATA